MASPNKRIKSEDGNNALSTSSSSVHIDDGIQILSPTQIVNRARLEYDRTVRKGEHRILALYSSVLGGIVTEDTPEFLTVPVDDHIVHRAHAVFDTCNVANGFAIGLDYHLDRLLASAKRSRISPPFADHAGLKRICLQTIAAASSTRDGGAYVRMWMTAGRGDFNVSPLGLVEPRANFYVVVHGYDLAAKAQVKKKGTKECVVTVPIKSQMLATMKTTNYLVNALAAMEAKESGSGNLGLQVDERGFFAETSIGSVGFVFANGVMKTPKLDFVLKSTTLIRAKELYDASPASVPSLKGGIEFANVSPSDLYDAKNPMIEMLAFGGGHIVGICTFNGQTIGTGSPGPVSQELDSLLQNDVMFRDKVEYM